MYSLLRHHYVIITLSLRHQLCSAVKRQKDDAERRYDSQMNDLRDRLEHSEATNRSMQSYVNFLKSSYQNTFGDDLAD